MVKPFEEDGVTIRHRPGAKNDWQVVIEFDSERTEWKPKNRPIFAWNRRWFLSEDYEYPDGYGSKMPLWLLIQLSRGNPEFVEAVMDMEERGEKEEMVTEFEKDVVENADEVIEMVEYLKEKCERNLEYKDEL